MPNVTIEVRKQYTPQEEEQIIAAVHAALMEGIKTPEWDRTIRLITHAPHRFAAPPGRGERVALASSRTRRTGPPRRPDAASATRWSISTSLAAARSKQSGRC